MSVDFSDHMAYVFQLAIEQNEFIYIADSAPFVNSVCRGLFTYNEQTQRAQYSEGWPRSIASRSMSTFHATQQQTMRQSDEDRRMQLLFDHFGKTLTDAENEVDIVAVYIMTTAKGVSVDYMDRERLYSFLCSNVKPDGVLQRYVVPQHRRHTLMQIVWTKDLALVEGRQNVHSIFDSSLTVSDRTATSAACPSKSTEVAVPKAVRARMTDLCRRFAKMLTSVGRETRRMCVYFTMSSENCLVMLWCSLLETEEIHSFVKTKTTPPRATTAPMRGGKSFTSEGPFKPQNISTKTLLSQPGTPLSSPNHRPNMPYFPIEDPIWFEHGVWLDNLRPTSNQVDASPPGIRQRHMVFVNFDPIDEKIIGNVPFRFGHDKECEDMVAGIRTSFNEFAKASAQRNFRAKERHLQSHRTQALSQTLEQTSLDPSLRPVSVPRPISRQSVVSSRGVFPQSEAFDKLQSLKGIHYITDAIADVRVRHNAVLMPKHTDLFHDYEIDRRMEQVRVQYVSTLLEDTEKRRTEERGSRRPGQISISERLSRMEQEQGWDGSVVAVKPLYMKKPSPLEGMVRQRAPSPAPVVVPPGVDTTSLAAPDGSLMNYMFAPGRMTPSSALNTPSHTAMSGSLKPKRGVAPKSAPAQPSRRFTVPPPPIMDVHNPHKSISQAMLLEASKTQRRPRLYDVLTKVEKKKLDLSKVDSTTPSPTSKYSSWRAGSPRSATHRLSQGGRVSEATALARAQLRGEYGAAESKLNARRMVDAAEDMIYRAYSMSLDKDTTGLEKYEFPSPQDISQIEIRSMILALGFEEKSVKGEVWFVLPSNHVRLSNALSTIQSFSRYVETIFDKEHVEHIATVRRLVENGLSFFDAVTDVKKAYPL